MAGPAKSDGKAPAGADNKEKAAPAKDGKKGGKKEEEEEDLSEEDRILRDRLVDCVESIVSGKGALAAMETMANDIRTSTSSMTAVPKPLKFLREHYGTLVKSHASMAAGPERRLLAEILSVLSMTHTEEPAKKKDGTTAAPAAAAAKRACLSYRLGIEEVGDIGAWGGEYVRHLSGEVGEEWQERVSQGGAVEPLVPLVEAIVPFHMSHHGEAEACDLLMEVGRLPFLKTFVDDSNVTRVCEYLVQCSHYVPEPEDAMVLQCAFEMYLGVDGHVPAAMQIALQVSDRAMVERAFKAAGGDLLLRRQLAYVLARQRFKLDVEAAAPESGSVGDEGDIMEIINNARLSEYYLALGKDLDILDPKSPEDIYKSHLTESASRAGGAFVDSARANLASTFVSALVNAGFGSDTLMLAEDGRWLYKNKDHGMMSAVASVGMLHLWNVDSGLEAIDKYLYAEDPYIRAGALLGIGVITSGVGDEDVDPAFALLSEHIGTERVVERLGVVTGLGLAYAGTARDDVGELLSPIIHGGFGIDSAATAALALGMVYVGTGNGDVAETILLRLIEGCGGGGGDGGSGGGDGASSSATPEFQSVSRMLCLALGLVFLGRQEQVEPTLDAIAVLSDDHGLRGYCEVTVESCAYAGTGNVLVIQKLLSRCCVAPDAEADGAAAAAAGGGAAGGGAGDAPAEEETEEQKKKRERRAEIAHLHLMASVVGIAAVAMGEPVGTEMCFRAFDHLLQYGEPAVRRAVPLAMGLLTVSNPRLEAADVLSKLSHDPDAQVARSAVFGLGLISAGTNNARVAAVLRQLSGYHARDPDTLYAVRLAQGLLHMGKGTITLDPVHADRTLVSRVSLGALLTIVHAAIDGKEVLMGPTHHYLMYYLAAGCAPRWLMTVDEQGEPLAVPVRVGGRVDTVGAAGTPARVTGFQTHETPVLVGSEERAEIVPGGRWEGIGAVMEGVIVCREREGWQEEEGDEAAKGKK